MNYSHKINLVSSNWVTTKLQRGIVMKSFIEQANTYYSYHTKDVTRYTHFVGVPLVILSLMILLGFVKIIIPGYLATDFAFILTIAALVYYFLLNWRLALVAVPLFAVMLWFASIFYADGPTKFGLWAFVITFFGGWACQIAGHIVEKRRPALLDNLSQALIAPLFLIAEVFFMVGKMQSLKEAIHTNHGMNNTKGQSTK
jgi:uncharacterized membrane protein YGL010W